MRRLCSVLSLLIFCTMLSAQPIVIGNLPIDIKLQEAKRIVRDAQDGDRGTLTVGNHYTTSELEAARKTLKDAEPKLLKMKVGEFEVVEPDKSVTTPLLWVCTDEAILERITVPANQAISLFMTRRGEASRKLHQFASKPYQWVILVAIKEGTTYVQIVRNGASADLPPSIIDRIDATVGETRPQPPPDPPMEDELLKKFRKAAQLDATQNLSDRKYLLPLAGIYESASEDTLEQFKTFGELDSNINRAVQAAGIPPPDKVFPALRKAIMQEIYERLNIDANAGNKTITDDTKRLARVCFGKIASALESLAK